MHHHEKMECAAPDCTQTQIGDSSHCISCKTKYNPIYGKYKDLHRKVKHKLLTDIKLLTEYDLLSLVSKIEQVYELRSAYRKLAFKPTYWDEGHDIVLNSLLQTLDTIRDELYDRFNTPVSNTNVEELEQDEPIDQDIRTSGSIIFITKQTILKKESEETWPHSEEIANNIKLNAAVQRNINWLTERILPLCTNIDNVGLLAFNQYLITQYVKEHGILQFVTLPGVLTGITRYTYQYVSAVDRESILKIAYSNLLQHKWLGEFTRYKTITRIRNSLINRRIYFRIYYADSKSELTEIYINIVDNKVTLQYTQDINTDVLNALDKMQKDTKGVISSNERSFVTDTVNYDKDRGELFKNGPVSVKDILNMSKDEIRSMSKKISSLRKHK